MPLDMTNKDNGGGHGGGDHDDAVSRATTQALLSLMAAIEEQGACTGCTFIDMIRQCALNVVVNTANEDTSAEEVWDHMFGEEALAELREHTLTTAEAIRRQASVDRKAPQGL